MQSQNEEHPEWRKLYYDEIIHIHPVSCNFSGQVHQIFEVCKVFFYVFDIETRILSCSNWLGNFIKTTLHSQLPGEKVSAEEGFTLKTILETGVAADEHSAFLDFINSDTDQMKHGCFTVNPSGELPVTFSVLSFPVFDANRKLIQRVGIAQDITEKRRSEESLRKHEMALEQLIEKWHFDIWQYDLQTSVFTVSEERHCSAGYEEHEYSLIGALKKICTPEDREKGHRAFCELIHEGKPMDIHMKIFRNGRKDISYTQVIGGLERDKAGNPKRVVGLLRDRTEDHLRDQTIQQSETRYRAIFEHSGDAIAIMEGETFAECNSQMLKLFGAECQEQIIGKTPWDLATETQQNGIPSRVVANRMILESQKNGTQSFEWISRRLDGTTFYSNVCLTQISCEGEKIHIALIRDITAQKLAAESVYYHQAYLHVLAEIRKYVYGLSEPDIISIFLENITAHFGFSKGWYGEFSNGVIGPSLHAGVSKNVTDVKNVVVNSLPPECPFPLVRAILWKKPCSLGKIQTNPEFVPWQEFAKKGNFHSTITFGFQVSGRLEGGFVFYSQEAIVRKNVTEYLLTCLNELARILSEKRLWEEQRRALRFAKEKAEQAAQTKSNFLANMSHEIRTPMTAILGYTEMLIDKRTAPDKYDDALKVIKNNTEFLLHILNDILDYSKIEAGMVKIDLQRCRIDEFMARIASLFHVKTQEKNLDFKIRSTTPLPEEIVTDPLRLQQIFLNLVGNAIKFTSKGSVEVVISWEGSKEEEFGQLHVDITDTGIGISENALDSIFSPFEQGDNSRTRIYGGTGLGLAISQRLVKLLGGELTVTSQSGQGSTFTVTLPQLVSANTRWEKDMNLAIVRTHEKENHTDTHHKQEELHGKRILLAEDGKDNQRLFTMILEKAGASVLVANNGQEAFDFAFQAMQEGRPFDIILMDMQMPVMDGYTATVHLRQRHYIKPIVALTAHAMSVERTKCLAAGCNDFITKPILRDALIDAVLNNIDVDEPVGYL
ncbi:MAG: response regulator [Planctomycetaceae bacterium]|jgi:PAS domain S-box-containing protein|nr:response regulator [Planctomycetaceae bacterium]